MNFNDFLFIEMIVGQGHNFVSQNQEWRLLHWLKYTIDAW